MRLLAATAVAALIATPVFAQDAAAPAAAPQEGAMETVEVNLVGADGESVGRSILTQTPNGLLVNNSITGLPDGPHAIHFHETGMCEGDFSSAGGHYNPGEMEHGYKVEGGPHAGDMPNFHVTDGSAVFDHVSPMVSLTGGEAPLNDEDGTALIIHAAADDYMSQPSGDSGDRIACGVVYPAQ